MKLRVKLLEIVLKIDNIIPEPISAGLIDMRI